MPVFYMSGSVIMLLRIPCIPRIPKNDFVYPVRSPQTVVPATVHKAPNFGDAEAPPPPPPPRDIPPPCPSLQRAAGTAGTTPHRRLLPRS